MTTQAARAATDGGSETARLYDTYYRQLYRYCLARLRSPEEAEDALQSIFVRIYAALCKGVEPRFEAAWIYKIAQNVCVTRSAVNGKRARFETPVDFDELDVAAAEGDSDVLLELEPALASLPKNLRDAILLREWQGLSYAEIAAELNTTVPAVETLIFRARRRLASALRAAGTGLLDALSLRTLVARLRGALTSAGTAKVAAGAAVVAIGAAGTTTVVARADHPRAVHGVDVHRADVNRVDVHSVPAPYVAAPVARAAVSHVGRRTRSAPVSPAKAAPARRVVVTPVMGSAPQPAPIAAPAATPTATPAQPPVATPAPAPQAASAPAVVATPVVATEAVVTPVAAAVPTIAPPTVAVVSVPTVTDVTAVVPPPPVTVPTLP